MPNGGGVASPLHSADELRVRHVTLAWDGPDAPLGSAQEFMPRGYELDSSIGLVATPAELRQHPRANQELRCTRALNSRMLLLYPGGGHPVQRGGKAVSRLALLLLHCQFSISRCFSFTALSGWWSACGLWSRRCRSTWWSCGVLYWLDHWFSLLPGQFTSVIIASEGGRRARCFMSRRCSTQRRITASTAS